MIWPVLRSVFLCVYVVLAASCTVESPYGNSLKTGNSAPSAKEISVNPPIEFDNKTQEEIYAIRKASVARHRDLLGSSYQPSEAVFGQIISNKPWLGIDGQFCGGNGRLSIDGVSEESRFILNPFLLLAPEEIRSWIAQGACSPSYPQPISLQWSAREHKAKVTYAMSEFYNQRRQNGFPRYAAEGSDLYLKNLNARDFGYEFVNVDRAQSVNIRRVDSAKMFEDSVQLSSFLHCGGSCGYPGGCNNGSPLEPDLYFNVDRLPASLYCKLWKSKPSSANADADFIFIIDFK
jgi:hypothetical protein